MEERMLEEGMLERRMLTMKGVRMLALLEEWMM